MSEIDGVADMATNPRSDELLLVLSGHQFSTATELGAVELLAGSLINPKTRCEKSDGGHPTPRGSIDRYLVPRCSNEAEDDPHCYPQRQQYTVRRSRARTPVADARVDHQPERRDCGVNRTGKPAQGLEDITHQAILAAAILAHARLCRAVAMWSVGDFVTCNPFPGAQAHVAPCRYVASYVSAAAIC